MAKKHVYEKSIHGIGDFVYVDLLPNVRRARQFNANVIIALLVGLVGAFFLVFLPYRDATTEYEILKGENNDLRHELTLTQEEFVGYGINLELVDYERQIDGLSDYRVDFNNLLDDVEIQVNNPLVDGKISFISYNAETQQLLVKVEVTAQPENFDTLELLFRGLDWVETTSSTTYVRIGDTLQYEKTFTLEVTPNVE